MSERELTDKLKPEYQRVLDEIDFTTFVSPYAVAKYVALRCESLAESQAKELAEAQARVVVLSEALLAAKNADDYTRRYRHLPDAQENIAEAQQHAETLRNDALATTDTAAQTLREKHYEECAVILSKNSDSYAANLIRAAAKEKP